MCEGNSAAGRRRGTLMLPERGSVVLLQAHTFIVRRFRGGGGCCRHKLERMRGRGSRRWGGGTTLPMLPLATLIKTGCR